MEPHPDLGFGATYFDPNGKTHFPFYMFEHGDRRVFYWNPEGGGIWLITTLPICDLLPEEQFTNYDHNNSEYYLPRLGALEDALMGKLPGIHAVHGGLIELTAVIHHVVSNLGGNNG